MGEADPTECARGTGALSLGLFCSIAVPLLFPCPYAVHTVNLLQLSLGDWAVGSSARQKARQEQEQLPDRREASGLSRLGPQPTQGVCGRRRL